MRCSTHDFAETSWFKRAILFRVSYDFAMKNIVLYCFISVSAVSINPIPYRLYLGCMFGNSYLVPFRLESILVTEISSRLIAVPEISISKKNFSASLVKNLLNDGGLLTHSPFHSPGKIATLSDNIIRAYDVYL